LLQGDRDLAPGWAAIPRSWIKGNIQGASGCEIGTQWLANRKIRIFRKFFLGMREALTLVGYFYKSLMDIANPRFTSLVEM
jgi:hypothetical protein